MHNIVIYINYRNNFHLFVTLCTRWLDKLGLSAYDGVGVVMRQTFLGGSYGLLDNNFSPNPVRTRITCTRYNYGLSYTYCMRNQVVVLGAKGKGLV